MKDINFIKTLSVKEQHGLRKWATFSCGMLGLVFIAIALLQIPQLNTLNKTNKEYQQLAQNVDVIHTRITQNQNLKSKMCCLGDQCKTIDALRCATKTPHECIQCISDACRNDIELNTCTIQNNSFQLTAQCKNVQQATHFMQLLKKDNHFSSVQLTSLQPIAGNFITCTIKGTFNR